MRIVGTISSTILGLVWFAVTFAGISDPEREVSSTYFLSIMAIGCYAFLMFIYAWCYFKQKQVPIELLVASITYSLLWFLVGYYSAVNGASSLIPWFFVSSALFCLISVLYLQTKHKKRALILESW